jgi:hypothetical protein
MTAAQLWNCPATPCITSNKRRPQPATPCQMSKTKVKILYFCHSYFIGLEIRQHRDMTIYSLVMKHYIANLKMKK